MFVYTDKIKTEYASIQTSIYKEQREKAEEIYELFACLQSKQSMQGNQSNKLLVTFVSSPQWGKTGVAIHLMYMMSISHTPYILSGMSDKEWKTQTQARVLPSFKNHVFHRNDLTKMCADLKNKQNILLIIDECHYGSENNQTLNHCLSSANILDIEYMQKNNIKILCISATPGNVLLDAEKWGSFHQTVLAKNTNKLYTGFDTLLREGRILSAPNLRKHEEVMALFDFIENRYKNLAKYHIIRASNRTLLESKILEVIGNKGYTYMMYDSASASASASTKQNKQKQIDTFLSSRPQTHHFIFIKGFWRAAKTINDTHIGICLDQSKDYTCTVQGLGGRLLGYNRSNAPVFMGNVEAIHEYLKILDNNIDYSQCKKYKSLNLVISNFNIKFQKPSTVHPDEIKNLPLFSLRKKRKSIQNLGKLTPDQINIKQVTQLTDYTNAEFISQFNLDIQNLPEKASYLNEILKSKGYSINVSYKKHPAKSVSNLVNFYTHPEWAACEYHIIRKDEDNIRVIKRNVDDLRDLKNGDKVAAHNSEGFMIMYKWFLS